jgi:hypothetical protein
MTSMFFNCTKSSTCAIDVTEKIFTYPFYSLIGILLVITVAPHTTNKRKAQLAKTFRLCSLIRQRTQMHGSGGFCFGLCISISGGESQKDVVLPRGWSIAASSELLGHPSIHASFEQSHDWRIRRMKGTHRTMTVGLRAEKWV